MVLVTIKAVDVSSGFELCKANQGSILFVVMLTGFCYDRVLGNRRLVVVV